ncbi:hypothetical protein NECAME_16922 [Necator americanus]|uniref:Oxoglutarate/iron-dependent oxygenase C-terminal degradation domain-containing protein n=1 Tax=Necator americanus TaxID=51031 RepID=W2TVK8_NECAM|nr:hypothetical protein NECAME_16922 [Necator americanus]ETN85087.1 hypothetical protein NECAME_16922 [Necator americanus]
MREWLANTSGIDLLPEVDSTGSCYATTDCLLPHSDQKAVLSSFFSDQVLNENSEKSMREIFKKSSELQIRSAFQNVFYDDFLLAMDSGNFVERGPVNKRWMNEYDIETASSDGCATEFIKALRSNTMMNFIKSVTGSEYEEPHTTLRIFRLTHGCYTVLGDEDAEQYTKNGPSIDFWFYFGRSNWNEDAGGEIVYIKKDVEEPILRCPPTVGAMAIVRRDEDIYDGYREVVDRSFVGLVHSRK